MALFYRCSRCRRLKQVTEFHKDDRNNNNHRGVCIVCEKIREIERKRLITQKENLTDNSTQPHNKSGGKKEKALTSK